MPGQVPMISLVTPDERANAQRLLKNILACMGGTKGLDKEQLQQQEEVLTEIVRETMLTSKLASLGHESAYEHVLQSMQETFMETMHTPVTGSAGSVQLDAVLQLATICNFFASDTVWFRRFPSHWDKNQFCFTDTVFNEQNFVDTLALFLDTTMAYMNVSSQPLVFHKLHKFVKKIFLQGSVPFLQLTTMDKTHVCPCVQKIFRLLVYCNLLNIDQVDMLGRTMVLWVSTETRIPIYILETLLQAGADPDKHNDLHQTPLHVATIAYGQNLGNPKLSTEILARINLLLEYGASVTRVNMDMKNVLHMAAKQADGVLFEIYLDAFTASAGVCCPEINPLYCRDVENCTPLIHAMHGGMRPEPLLHILRKYVQHGYDLTSEQELRAERDVKIVKLQLESAYDGDGDDSDEPEEEIVGTMILRTKKTVTSAYFSKNYLERSIDYSRSVLPDNFHIGDVWYAVEEHGCMMACVATDSPDLFEFNIHFDMDSCNCANDKTVCPGHDIVIPVLDINRVGEICAAAKYKLCVRFRHAENALPKESDVEGFDTGHNADLFCQFHTHVLAREGVAHHVCRNKRVSGDVAAYVLGAVNPLACSQIGGAITSPLLQNIPLPRHRRYFFPSKAIIDSFAADDDDDASLDNGTLQALRAASDRGSEMQRMVTYLLRCRLQLPPELRSMIICAVKYNSLVQPGLVAQIASVTEQDA